MEQRITLRSLIGNLLFFGIVLLIFSRFLSVWSGTAFPISLISADSMRPTLFEGDVIAWMPTDINEIEIGDVIVFKSSVNWPEERFVVHRVVDIKSTSDGPAFETKGDNNNWTDQAGPHIIEPYITSRSYIGKTISIAKQPLKIPFVGLIGIWINDGFDSLTRPTAEKGAMSILGIFTPLSIAIILFIVSLFILPEKTKDLRQKLRLLIFGPRQYNLKKVLLFFLVLYIILLSSIHIFAFDDKDGSLGIGEFPDESSFELGSLPLDGGETNPKTMMINNPSFLPVKGFLSGGGGLTPFIPRQVFILDSLEMRDVSVTAESRGQAEPGAYNGKILVYSSPIWFLLPDLALENIFLFTSEITVFIFDFITSCMLTFFTVLLIVAIDYSNKWYQRWCIDRCWVKIKRSLLERCVLSPTLKIKQSIVTTVKERGDWLSTTFESDSWKYKPVIASLVVLPFLCIIQDDMLAMVISSFSSGLISYFISCKQRSKVILATLLPLCYVTIYIIMKTNLFVFSQYETLLEPLTIGLGVMALYLLILGLILIPIVIIPWEVSRYFRNLKERKNPLAIMEGPCDL